MVLTNALMLIYNDATTDDSRSLSSPGLLSDWFLNFSGTTQNPDGRVMFASETINKLTVSILPNQIKHSFSSGLFKGINMTFPIDNTFSDCYNYRKSCVEKDFSAEVSVLIFYKNQQLKTLHIG